MSQVTRRQAAANQGEQEPSSSHKDDDFKGNVRSTNKSYQKEEVKDHPESEVRKDGADLTDPGLPMIEVAFYVICIVVIMVKANVLAVYQKSNDHIGDFGSYNLQPGWKVLGRRKQDVSDFEWSYIKKSNFSLPFLAALFGHVIIGRIVDVYSPKMKSQISLVYNLACVIGFVGWKVFLVFVFHTVVTFVASRTRLNSVVWVAMIFQIATLNFDPFLTFQRHLFEDESDFHNLIFGVSMCQLRLLSFGIDYCQNGRQRTKKTDDKGGKEDKTDRDSVEAVYRWSFYHVVVYNFWLPLFAGGPVLTYDKFRAEYYQDPKPLTKEDLKKIAKEMIRYAFWWLLIDVALHFLYFPAFQQRKHLLMFLPSWAIGGIALNHLIFFQVKYVVMYGIPRAIALFDRVQAPLPPICVLGTYMFQDFWRYFDRGLHRLVVNCIYIPLGGSRRGLLLQLLSSMLCFVFVYFWHGSDTHLLYWCLFNWLGVTIEQLLDLTITKYGLKTYCRHKLSGAMYRRLVGILRTPIYICLAASNLVFLAGTRIAYTYFDRLILSGWPYEALTTAFLLYCFIQVVKEFHRAYGKRYMCLKEYAS